MKKIILFVLISSSLSAQYQYTKKQNNFDFALAFGSAFSPSVSYQKLYGIGNSDRFKIGWGIRFNAFMSGQQDFITAPAKLTSGKESIFALFSENIAGNLDTLQLNNSAIASLNSVFMLQYSFKKLDVGFNIDALGFTFGSKQSGKFMASESNALNNSIQIAKPTSFNLLLISDSDRGSLNSELYLRYWLNKRFAVRTGASFQFVEYKTDKLLTFENDRFRHKTLLPFVAITFSPFK